MIATIELRLCARAKCLAIRSYENYKENVIRILPITFAVLMPLPNDFDNKRDV